MFEESVLRSSCTSVVLECKKNSEIKVTNWKDGLEKSFEQIGSIGAGIYEKLAQLKDGDKIIMTFLISKGQASSSCVQ
jgi:hypothetical protein